MKKIAIALILAVFVTAIAFIKPVESHAETPDVFMMNDIFLYDHDSFNFSPNFENDYLLSATILPNAVETEISAFIGWYKDLGYTQLLVPYYGADVDNDHLVYFAIPCYDILAANFQLGYIAQTPFNIRFGVVFTDGTRQEWDTETNGFGKQILTISNSNLLKNIDAFYWEAKTADYVPSFKFLGVTDGYEIGYQHGDNDGYNTGYQVGYNLGFRNGFQDGISQSEDVVIYENVLNFNQKIQNGNFNNTDYWSQYSYTTTFLVENNTMTATAGSEGLSLRQNLTETIPQGHHIFIKFKAKSNDSDALSLILRQGATTITAIPFTISTEYTTLTNLVVLSADINRIEFVRLAANISIDFKEIQIIDLTLMYGDGYEPTYDECLMIFSPTYYDYTLDTPIQMGFFTGYYEGKDIGISQGIDIGESNQITMTWIQSIFQAIQGILNIAIFPRVTIGVIVGIPFVISLAWFVIKMFRGGGGGE